MDFQTRIPAAGALIFDDVTRILLVRRGREPGRGLWSIPGGKCLPGEAPSDCCVRETFEECGLVVRAVRFAGRVERAASRDAVFVIDDYLCELVEPESAGRAAPADDAEDLGWFHRADMVGLPLVEGLVEALSEWNLMPA